MITAAVLLAAALAGSVASSVLIWRAHEQTKHALERVEAKEAEDLAHLKWAEKNFGKACAGVTQLLLVLQERRYADNPQFARLRRDLADRALNFFEAFLNEGNPDPAVQLETGRTHLIVATVYGLQGDKEGAKKAYAKAITLFEELNRKSPENPTYLYEMALGHNILGLVLDSEGRRDEARAEFVTAVGLYREALKRQADFRAYNDFAWMRATCPQDEFRDPAEAVQMAWTATVMAPDCGIAFNTLGVAHYRAKNWRSAVEVLKRSMQLRDGGDSADWFFLAMAYKQLGDEKQARAWYAKAQQDVQKANLSFEPLSRYRKEAEALFGDRCRSQDDRAPEQAATHVDFVRLAASILTVLVGVCPVCDSVP